MDQTFVAPQGYTFAGVYCGIKRKATKKDLMLVVSDRPAVAAGVYTQNLVVAAPVILDRQRTPSDRIRAVVGSSGVANACTGQRGLDDARRMTALAAEACGLQEEQVLVMTTGVIGAFLPMDKIAGGIEAARAQLGNEETHVVDAARGIMTTDTVHKLAQRSMRLGDRTVRLLGIAKGAAMIGPNMATMLGLILTDAALTQEHATAMLRDVTRRTFNCISVEGHTSTNDTVLLLANGAACDQPLDGDDLRQFQVALEELATELARAIPADGEGVTHLVTIDVTGCATWEAAKQIAKTVADSALVKTAIAGGDPNWGRIVSAAGYAGVPFDPMRVGLKVNGYLLYERGTPVEFDAGIVSSAIRENRETSIELFFGEGDASARFWTTDLTTEYVHLNADYHT